MKKILVTGANGDIGEAVGRILIKEFPQYEITGCDCAGDLPGSFIFSKMILVPKASNSKYEEFIKDWISHYDLIIPTTEPEIKKIVSLSDYEDKFLILPKFYVKTFLDKYSTYKYLKSKNFNPPETELLAEVSEVVLPIYLKPRFGAGGKGNRILRNRYDFLSSKNLQLEEWIVQDLLLGEDNEYTCAIFKCDDFTEILQMKRTLYGGHTGVAEVVDEPEIRKLLLNLASSLDLIGCLNIQLKLTDTGPKIFEINPRLSSTVMMRNRIGFQDCLWWIKYKLGVPVDKREKVKVGTKIFRMSNEHIFVP